MPTRWPSTPGGTDLSPDGRLLATETRNGFISIWELATGRLLHSMKAGESLRASLSSYETGSLYGFQHIEENLVEDNTWFSQQVVAIGNRIVIKVNNRIVVDFVDEKNTYTSGHLALQQFGLVDGPSKDPLFPVIAYCNVMVKPLPDDAQAAWAKAKKDIPDIN